MKSPMVSVCLNTENSAEHISQALDSVLMQQSDFDFEIVVGDNCSVDKTRNILLSYKEKYPDKIKLLFFDEKLGHIQSFLKVWETCRPC